MNQRGGVRAHAVSHMGADKLTPDQFYGVITDVLREAGVESNPQQKLPLVMCGMVGSRHGWVEAPYLPIPLLCKKIPEQSVHVKTELWDVYIMPGLSVQDATTPDVMRGEETQLLGLYVQNSDFSGVFCMPGTHSKWGVIEAGMIKAFQTAMTGELFALLSRQSVIRHVIGDDFAFEPEHPAFKQAVLEGYHHPERLLFELFPVRAGGLLFSCTGHMAAMRLSGLLIGAELSAAVRKYPLTMEIALIATGKLARLYAQSFKYIQREFMFFDADQLVQDGLKFCATMIFKDKDELSA